MRKSIVAGMLLMAAIDGQLGNVGSKQPAQTEQRFTPIWKKKERTKAQWKRERNRR